MSNNKQAGMPSDNEITKTVRGMILYSTEHQNLIAHGMKLMRDRFCPPPKSEAEVEEETKKVLTRLKQRFEGIKKFGDKSYSSYHGTEGLKDIQELSRLLSASSKGKYSEEASAHIKEVAVGFAEWMLKNECSAPITAGNMPLWFGDGIDGKTSEHLFDIYLKEREGK